MKFLNIIRAIFCSLVLFHSHAFAQDQEKMGASLVQIHPTSAGKEFVRFSSFPIANSNDRNVIVEICQSTSNAIVCKPLGKGYYSLMAIKKIAGDSMMKAHLSAAALAGVVALTAALAMPVLAGIMTSGILLIGTTGPIGGFIIGAGLAATSLYFFGMHPKAATVAATPAGALTALGVISAESSLLASLVVVSGFAYSVVIPFSAGWKVLDVVGLNPVKNYSKAFTLREVYKRAGENGSTDQIETVQKILENLSPVSPFADSSLTQAVDRIP